ncbi:MAG: S1 family peptidase [Gemmataceae bacterium]
MMHWWTLLLLLPGQAVESKDFPKDLQMKAVAATVRVANRSQHTEGTGVVIGFDKEGIYVLTAAHMVLNSDRFEISTFSESSYPRALKSYEKVELLAKTLDIRDLALIRLPTEDRPPAVMPFCPRDQLPTGKNFEALSVGCGSGMIPLCMLEYVLREKRFSRPPLRDSARLWETAIGQVPGRSGGPLLNKRGELIGLASGESEGKGYYCHVAEIHSWLKESKHAFLVGENQKEDKTVKSTETPRRTQARVEKKSSEQTFNNYLESRRGGENNGMIVLLFGGLLLLVGLLSWLGYRAVRRRWHRSSSKSRHGHRHHHHRSSTPSRRD